MRLLSGRHQVLPGKELLNACRELGIPFKRGTNIAIAAQRLEAIAVIGGKFSSRRLSVAVFDGKRGDVLLKRNFPWRSRPSRSQRRRLGAALLSAVQRAAKLVGGGDGDSGGGGLTFKPEVISKTGDDATEEPPPLRPPAVAPEEDPETAKLSFSAERKTAATVQQAPARQAARQTSIAGTVGLGVWSRSFTLSDPAQSTGPHFNYSSGAAFAISVALTSHPAAFFSDGFLADFFLRMRFRSTVGLSSRLNAAGGTSEPLDTTMWQLLIDLGYDWQIVDKPWSPVVEGGLGFSLLKFGINWPATNPAQLPSANYTAMLIGIGIRYPIVQHLAGTSVENSVWRDLGVRFRFDYLPVLSNGGVSDDIWYGSASVGAIALELGLMWQYKGIVAGLGYGYTRYFYSFDAFNTRVANNQKAAGGALDQYHAFQLQLGYAIR
ncbi:MAG: hypothetical protein H6707_15650 [Deltaproteobacteria bacterium]|nr:hypothetical protein [Deltaproteobacteria bacterium]